MQISVEELYQNLTNKRSDIPPLKAPRKYIASYIRITPEFPNTIRNKRPSSHLCGDLKAADIFEKRISESNNSTDYSRLCWLNVHIKQQEKALSIARKSLELNPECKFCAKLVIGLES